MDEEAAAGGSTEEVAAGADDEEPVQYAEVYFEYHGPSEEGVEVKTEQSEIKPVEQDTSPAAVMMEEVMEVDETEQIVSTTSTPEPISDASPPTTDTDIVTEPPEPDSEPSNGEKFQSAAPTSYNTAPTEYTSPHAGLFEGDNTPLNAPVKELKEKWKLLPAFLQVNILKVVILVTD